MLAKSFIAFALLLPQLALSADSAPASPAPKAATGSVTEDQLPADTIESSSAAVTRRPAPKNIDNRPVSQAQFKAFLDIYRRNLERMEQLERENKSLLASGAKGAKGEEAVDLSNPTAVGTTPTQAGRNGSPHGGGGGGAMPDFKVYFDLNFIVRPGLENMSFDSYHNFLFFEIIPTPQLQFSFDVNPSPRYFEVDYQVTPKLQLRAGKIWIPFDDMSPHNIFGGRVDVSRLAPSSNTASAPAFLPDLWTDLGVGFKLNLIDTMRLSLDLYGYVVNGFGQNGVDPVNPGSPYPSFSDIPIGPDNNRDKAFGGRAHMLIGQRLGVGLSYYTGRWNNDTGSTPGDIPSERVNIVGLDGQLRIKNSEFRLGVVNMLVDLPTGDSMQRGGGYLEFGQKFGGANDWKALIRTGLLQVDSRVSGALGDEEIVGATLLWKPGLLQYSIEYSYDLQQTSFKANYSYFAARLVMAF